jgi:hypothetical protein
MIGGPTCANSVARADVDNFFSSLVIPSFLTNQPEKRCHEASKFSLLIHELVFYFCSDGVDVSRIYQKISMTSWELNIELGAGGKILKGLGTKAKYIII